MNLQPGYLVLAQRLQEAASDLSAGDIRNRLSDAIADEYRGTGHYAHYIDHAGDADSGDVIYCCDDETMRAPYTIAGAEGAATCSIDFESAEDVVGRMVWETEADEEDHYAAMDESFKAAKLYTELPLYERFISQKQRKEIKHFAGKGKSFPIEKPEDVAAAARSLGRAGSSNYSIAKIKSNIIRIAKELGASFVAKLPKAWKAGGEDAKEADVSRESGDLALVESAATIEPIVLREARADYEIKLIAPGKGSSAFYPAEVLKRDGPKVFGAGTHVYLNHPTAAEESARPEGDVTNLAGVLTSTAEYREQHAKGPGLYARMKVFADHAQLVEEKAPHVGMSIRASGVAESGKSKDGLPVLKELTAAASVDVVTRAGAGGMILTESAKAGNEDQGMDEAKVLQMIEAAVKTATEPLHERARQGDATVQAYRIMAGLALPEASKQRVVENVTRGALPVKDGVIDAEALKTLVMAEAQREGQYIAQITGAGRVVGMGAGMQFTEAAQPEPDKKALKEAKREKKALKEASRGAFSVLMGGGEAAKIAADRFKGVA